MSVSTGQKNKKYPLEWTQEDIFLHHNDFCKDVKNVFAHTHILTTDFDVQISDFRFVQKLSTILIFIWKERTRIK